MTSILLISDLDNTLLGDDESLRRFTAWHEVRRGQVLLAYSSGRFCHSIAESVRSTDLPEPDAMIGGVGTDIRLTAEGRRLEDWPECNGWSRAAIREILRNDELLEPQPDELQSDFKISYFGYGLTRECLAGWKQKLAAEGQHVELVYSSNRDLDILPAETNKGTAAARLARHFGMAADRVIVAGDSGNDAAMFQQGFRGIVVANAQDELKRTCGENIYHSPAGFAAGVLDGLLHWVDRIEKH